MIELGEHLEEPIGRTMMFVDGKWQFAVEAPPDAKPNPDWISVRPIWWNRRELVRKIAEGMGYTPTIWEAE